MTPERWQRIKQVLDLMADAREGPHETLLAEACGDDHDLCAEVESLLSFEERADVLDRAADRDPAAPPDRIGPWQVRRLLGVGGMGTVYLAERGDDQFRKQAAIKLIQTGLDREMLGRFRAERQILADLEHPNIARLLDGGALPDGRPYLVMEYIDGRRIDDYCAEDPARESATTLRLFLKVCAAVQFAHSNLVVHRDLKPGNILVTSDGEPHLLDFGIAKLIHPIAADVEKTQEWQRFLTPASASPEQVAGLPITTAADVYSLGTLLYLLVTRTSVYAGTKDFKTNPTAAILHYEPPLASRAEGLSPKLRRWLAGDLENVIRKAIEKNPAQRYSTVEELASDIRRFLDGHPVTAHPASLLHRARKFAARNRVLMTASALLLAAICAGVTGTLWYAHRAGLAEARAERRLESLNKLTNSMLFEIDGITNLPGATSTRKELTARVLQYLDGLAADSQNNSELLLNLADAYERLGQVEANELTAHAGGVGSLAAAKENYRKAEAIMERLVAADPRRRSYQLKLLHMQWNIAQVFAYEGDTSGDLAVLREALAKADRQLAADPAADLVDNELQYWRGSVFTAIGDAELELGHLDTAMASQRRGLAVRQAILDAHPGNTRAMRATAISHEYLGDVLAAMNRYADAAREQKAGLHLIETVADPRNVDHQSIVAGGSQRLCEYLARTGHWREAFEACEKSLRIDRTMAAADPNNVQPLEDLASTTSTMSLALELAGRGEDALQRERDARALFEAASARDPDSRANNVENARSMVHLGRLEATLHRREEATAHLRQAKEMLGKLAARGSGQSIELPLRDAEVTLAGLAPAPPR